METWDFDAPTQDPRIQNVQSYITQRSQSTKAGLNAARMLGLYGFLKAHPFSSPEDLRKAVTQGGEPMFTPEEAAQVHEALKQKGGGAPPPEFFDKIIRKLLTINPFTLLEMAKSFLPMPSSTGTGGLPFQLPSLKSLIFMLYAFERDPNYGPLLSVALDTTTKLLPTIAMSAQTMAAPLAGLIPLPGAGAAGAMIGWAVGAVFAFTAILMNLSRRKFGTAFVTSMGLIPVAGPAIMEAAEDLESTMARVSQRREKLVQSTRSVLGDAIASQVEGIIPDLTTEQEDEIIDPPFQVPVLPKLTDIVNPAALTASPAQIEKLSDQATGEAPTPPEPLKLPTSLADIKSSVPSLTNLAANLPAIPQVPANLSGLANVAKSSLPPLPKPPTSLPMNPIEAFKTKTGQIAKGRNGLTGGGPRTPQWQTITIRSERHYGSGLRSMTVPVSYRTS